eukprot:g66398.t1
MRSVLRRGFDTYVHIILQIIQLVFLPFISLYQATLDGSAFPSVRMDTLGEQFKVGGSIGIGTYGEVRYGRNSLGEHCALKIVDSARLQDSQSAAVIQKEIKILKRLRHPNVISIRSVKSDVPYKGTWCHHCACSQYSPTRNEGDKCRNCSHSGLEHTQEEVRNVLVIIEECAPGGELFGLLMYCGKFTEDIARFYFKQLICGLEYIHSKGIYHRDLKPENLVLDQHFNLKMVDFGLAALLSEHGSQRLHSGVGSQPYSAPEVYYARQLFEGLGYDGGPADIWSCGVILFVMLVGRPPFLRPLMRNYGPGLKKDNHFIEILQGKGFGDISPAAKNLLEGMFTLDPSRRFTLKQIKQSRWFNQALPSRETVQEVMTQKSRRLWSVLGKAWMLDILRQMRADSDQRALELSSEEDEEDEEDEDDEDEDEDDLSEAAVGNAWQVDQGQQGHSISFDANDHQSFPLECGVNPISEISSQSDGVSNLNSLPTCSLPSQSSAAPNSPNEPQAFHAKECLEEKICLEENATMSQYLCSLDLFQIVSRLEDCLPRMGFNCEIRQPSLASTVLSSPDPALKTTVTVVGSVEESSLHASIWIFSFESDDSPHIRYIIEYQKSRGDEYVFRRWVEQVSRYLGESDRPNAIVPR